MKTNEKLNKMNNELKVYINESEFISNKCRNKLIKILGEEFSINFGKTNYKNIDIEILEDGNIKLRGDLYKSNNPINSYNDIEERYNSFKEKAERLIKRKEIDFQNMSNMNNITNLIIIICLFLIGVAILILGVHAFLVGDFFDCIWLFIFIIPWIIPNIKRAISTRWNQAKRYLKSLFKRVK